MNKKTLVLLSCFININAPGTSESSGTIIDKNTQPAPVANNTDTITNIEPKLGGAATATATTPTSPTNPTPSRVDQAINLSMEIARSEVVQNTIKTLAALGTSAAVTAIKSTYDGDRALGKAVSLKYQLEAYINHLGTVSIHNYRQVKSEISDLITSLQRELPAHPTLFSNEELQRSVYSESHGLLMGLATTLNSILRNNEAAIVDAFEEGFKELKQQIESLLEKPNLTQRKLAGLKTELESVKSELSLQPVAGTTAADRIAKAIKVLLGSISETMEAIEALGEYERMLNTARTALEINRVIRGLDSLSFHSSSLQNNLNDLRDEAERKLSSLQGASQPTAPTSYNPTPVTQPTGQAIWIQLADGRYIQIDSAAGMPITAQQQIASVPQTAPSTYKAPVAYVSQAATTPPTYVQSTPADSSTDNYLGQQTLPTALANKISALRDEVDETMETIESNSLSYASTMNDLMSRATVLSKSAPAGSMNRAAIDAILTDLRNFISTGQTI